MGGLKTRLGGVEGTTPPPSGGGGLLDHPPTQPPFPSNPVHTSFRGFPPSSVPPPQTQGTSSSSRQRRRGPRGPAPPSADRPVRPIPPRPVATRIGLHRSGRDGCAGTRGSTLTEALLNRYADALQMLCQKYRGFAPIRLWNGTHVTMDRSQSPRSTQEKGTLVPSPSSQHFRMRLHCSRGFHVQS